MSPQANIRLASFVFGAIPGELSTNGNFRCLFAQASVTLENVSLITGTSIGGKGLSLAIYANVICGVNPCDGWKSIPSSNSDLTNASRNAGRSGASNEAYIALVPSPSSLLDRKSTRLNSSHGYNSYSALF